MPEYERKIHGLPILAAFAFLSDIKNSEPLLIYNKKPIHEFLYEKWRHRKELFEDFFTPEWDAAYPCFRDFDDSVRYNATTLSIDMNGSRIKKVRLNEPDRILKELTSEPLIYLLEIGTELYNTFSCQKDSNITYE